ncbi:hypothetical protein SAMN04489724_3087 [Algoriphagus locisalis]|uniref:Uncharacterized protein n=1 Tax=Algoriphagus locisalis TaxID=305507 RepID=A0A1I7CDJ6_9BACT|nr:hypothetical protein SAMN04489724_3087 [Algoriphagus locisalis]
MLLINGEGIGIFPIIVWNFDNFRFGRFINLTHVTEKKPGLVDLVASIITF